MLKARWFHAVYLTLTQHKFKSTFRFHVIQCYLAGQKCFILTLLNSLISEQKLFPI